MENQEIKRSVKLGAFVSGAIVLFLMALFYLGREGNLFNKTFAISAIFRNVEGLKEGDKVWLSGVKIGVVKRVQIISEGKVIVTLSLKDKQNKFIKKDAIAFVGSDGLVGNKIVVVKPGKSNLVILENDTIQSLSPTDTQELFTLAKEVGMSSKSITNDLKEITDRLNNGEGIVGELLKNGTTSSDLKTTISSMRKSMDNMYVLTTEAKEIIQQVKSGKGPITKLLYDTSYTRELDAGIKNLALVGIHSKNISENLDHLVANIKNGKSVASVMLSDSVMATKLRTTITNTESASTKLDKNMEALQHNFLFRRYFRKQKK